MERLEPRQVFAYDIASLSVGGTQVDGWSVFGTGTQFLTITTTSDSTTFDNGNDFTVQFGTQGVPHATWVANHTLNVALPPLNPAPWNGTQTNYANIAITQSNVAATSTNNGTFIAYPANIVSLSQHSVLVGEAVNLTLTASNAARGFGNLTNHSFYFVNASTSSPSFAGTATNSTSLTITVPSGVLPAGNYTLQTTPSGVAPGNASDTSAFALTGNLSFAVTEANYTISSLAYKSQPISGWSWVGSGNETISITLANGSTPFAANQTVWFGNTSMTGVKTSDLTLNVAVPSLPGYGGTPTNQNLSFGVVPNANTTNGGFLYSNIALSGPSNSTSYVSGGGSLTLTAASVPFGFNPSENLTVVFDDGIPAHKKSTNPTPPTNSSSLTVNLPTFAATGNYSVFIQSTGTGNPRASNLLNLTVLPNPAIGNLTITFKNDTGLNATTSPPLDGLYAYVYGNVSVNGSGLVGGFLGINSSTGLVGTSPQNSINGTKFTTLTANGAHNATLFFDLSNDAVYNGTRVYLSSEANLSKQPTAGNAPNYYDFIEIAASGSNIFADTSQVDQFGMPFTLNLTLDAPGGQTANSGISPGLTRQDIIEGYATAFQNIPGYNLALVPPGGLGNQTLQTYRFLAPNDLLNSRTAGGLQQGAEWTWTITPQNGTLAGPSGNFPHWAYLNLSGTTQVLNGALYPQGSPVTGPWIPAGAMVAETNSGASVTSFKIGTYDSAGFTNQAITIGDAGGVRIQQVSDQMKSVGYQTLVNTFGPSVYHGSGTAPWSDLTLLNTDNAIDRLFARYQNGTYWWQEENQPATTLADKTKYPQATALYRGEVTSVTRTGIDGASHDYAVLKFVDYSNGTANNELTFEVFYPYFTTNSPANKTDPFGRPVPAPPSWFDQGQGNFDPPSLSVFAGAGIFQPGGAIGVDKDAYNDLGRDVAVALSRGYASTFLSTGVPVNNLSNPNLPVFSYTGGGNTAGNWTMPTAVYSAMNGIVTPGMVVSSFLNFGSPMTVTGVSTVGPNTVIDVVSYVAGSPIKLQSGTNADNLQFVTFAQNGTTYPGGGQIPYNLYESFIQSRGEFSQGVSNGTGFEKINIDGLAYGYAFSDFMGLSSTISAFPDTGPTAPATQATSLTVTMQPWFNTVTDVSYDIQSVAFGVTDITGWSLFGSGADTVTVTTTANSTPFTTSGSYNLSFGNVAATATATGNHTLTVAIPSLVSRWAGNGTSFANLTITGGNTTGNTTFAVLPVTLTAISPNNGPVTGGTSLNLTAIDKQHGFGNVANIPVGFTLGGTAKAGINVTTSNATSLTLLSPSSPDHAAGNATVGIFSTAGLTSLASNNLTFTYAAAPVAYDIQSVAFNSQNISGWSLFGSGADTVTVTTTANSTPFTVSDSYNLSFGNVAAKATATGNHALTVAIPSLVSRWAGNGTSFANLTITGGNTTGSTNFAVLPVTLTGISPNNGPVTGGTSLNLTALDKQHGFGNATNVAVGLSLFGATTAATNVAVVNTTTLSLSTPVVGEPGNWSIAVYKPGGFSATNLASNNLTYAYTEKSLAFVSGDFNADNLTDVATLLDDGRWQVSFTQSAGNATLATLNAANNWSTSVVWKDWLVLRNGDRDVVVARAEATNAGSWWKLSYDGPANGTSATDFSTNFVGSWAYSGGVSWLNVVSGDFDGNGKIDIAGRDSTNSQWWMLANATQNAVPSTSATKNVLLGGWNPLVQWDQVVAGNFTGKAQGKTQLAGLTGNTWWISEYVGSQKLRNTVMTTQWPSQQGFTNYLAGNFDGAANGRALIAAKTSANAWYSIGYNASVPPSRNTPRLMGSWPGPTTAYTNIVTGDFRGTGNGTVGIAGLQRSGGNAAWYVLERTGGNYAVSNFGTWPQTSVAQAFSGYFVSSDRTPTARTGILTRTRQAGGLVWVRGASNGTAFATSQVSGYPS